MAITAAHARATKIPLSSHRAARTSNPAMTSRAACLAPCCEEGTSRFTVARPCRRVVVPETGAVGPGRAQFRVIEGARSVSAGRTRRTTRSLPRLPVQSLRPALQARESEGSPNRADARDVAWVRSVLMVRLSHTTKTFSMLSDMLSEVVRSAQASPGVVLSDTS
jgi:hypothetical protein